MSADLAGKIYFAGMVAFILQAVIKEIMHILRGKGSKVKRLRDLAHKEGVIDESVFYSCFFLFIFIAATCWPVFMPAMIIRRMRKSS